MFSGSLICHPFYLHFSKEQVKSCISSQRKERAMTDEMPDGKAKGGVARAKALSPERRREIALLGVAAKKERAVERAELDKLPKTTHEGGLEIGEILIPCAVREAARRVLTQ